MSVSFQLYNLINYAFSSLYTKIAIETLDTSHIISVLISTWGKNYERGPKVSNNPRLHASRNYKS